ncbi:hypothetical protein VTH06DRAFT_8221 [Thermothelomyces fergusii]
MAPETCNQLATVNPRTGYHIPGFCFFILAPFFLSFEEFVQQPSPPPGPTKKNEFPGNPLHSYPYHKPSGAVLKSGTPAIARRLPPSPVLPTPDPQTARVAPDDERKLKFGPSNFDTFTPEHLSTGAIEVVVPIEVNCISGIPVSLHSVQPFHISTHVSLRQQLVKAVSCQLHGTSCPLPSIFRILLTSTTTA